MDPLLYLPVAAAAYLLGSIPTGAIVARLYRNLDLTRVGSQRTGFANATRALGLGAGLIVLVGDFAKAAVAVWIAQIVLGTAAGLALAGFLSVLGHIRSVFLGGRGGRGIVPGLGGLAVATPGLFVVAAGTGCLVIALTRYVSLGSLAGTVATLVVGAGAYATGMIPVELMLYAVAGSALMIAAHRDNIARLRAGTERRIGQPEPVQADGDE